MHSLHVGYGGKLGRVGGGKGRGGGGGGGGSGKREGGRSLTCKIARVSKLKPARAGDKVGVMRPWEAGVTGTELLLLAGSEPDLYKS